MFWNRNYFLRFRFRLLKSYSSGSDFDKLRFLWFRFHNTVRMDPFWFGSLDPDPYLDPCEPIAANANPKSLVLRYMRPNFRPVSKNLVWRVGWRSWSCTGWDVRFPGSWWGTSVTRDASRSPRRLRSAGPTIGRRSFVCSRSLIFSPYGIHWVIQSTNFLNFKGAQESIPRNQFRQAVYSV